MNILQNIGGVLIASVAIVTAPFGVVEYVAEEPVPLPLIVTAESSPEEIREYIRLETIREGVSFDLVHSIVNCESSYVPQQSKCINPSTGQRENSWGVWQIHLDSHDVTKEQAMDPMWSTEWALEEIKSNGPGIWSCPI